MVDIIGVFYDKVSVVFYSKGLETLAHVLIVVNLSFSLTIHDIWHSTINNINLSVLHLLNVKLLVKKLSTELEKRRKEGNDDAES